jgi:hypothetical protein
MRGLGLQRVRYEVIHLHPAGQRQHVPAFLIVMAVRILRHGKIADTMDIYTEACPMPPVMRSANSSYWLA